jgi:hypothetical protein
VTPLADALLLDSDGVLKNLKRIYVQGNVIVDKRTNRLKPDPQVARRTPYSRSLVF